LGSRDALYLYLQDFQCGREQPILRARLRDRKLEKVITRDQLLRSDICSSASPVSHQTIPLLVTVVNGKADIDDLSVDCHETDFPRVETLSCKASVSLFPRQ
jgi:hypothetical protein